MVSRLPASIWPRPPGGPGSPARLARAGFDTGFFGKAHFSTRATYQPTDTPECKTGSQSYPDDWNGPYMGFSHVELIVHGHLSKARANPIPPEGQHYERYLASRLADGGAYELWAAALPPSPGAARACAFGPAGEMAQQHLDRRPHHRLAARPEEGHAVLHLGLLRRPASRL